MKWQIGVWNRISPIYLQAIDNRFTGVVDAVIRRAALQSAQQVLDLGTGTGAVAIKAASLVMPGGNVAAVDISPEMLDLARQRSGPGCVQRRRRDRTKAAPIRDRARQPK